MKKLTFSLMIIALLSACKKETKITENEENKIVILYMSTISLQRGVVLVCRKFRISKRKWKK